LWIALLRHMSAPVLVGLGCAVYAIVWGAIGRRRLRTEFEGLI